MNKNIYIVECISVSETMTLHAVYKMNINSLGEVWINDQHTR